MFIFYLFGLLICSDQILIELEEILADVESRRVFLKGIVVKLNEVLKSEQEALDGYDTKELAQKNVAAHSKSVELGCDCHKILFDSEIKPKEGCTCGIKEYAVESKKYTTLKNAVLFTESTIKNNTDEVSVLNIKVLILETMISLQKPVKTAAESTKLADTIESALVDIKTSIDPNDFAFAFWMKQEITWFYLKTLKCTTVEETNAKLQETAVSLRMLDLDNLVND
ncbi:hypothetical protein ECANGB1_681 [Enterospora canceri]|uniref:Uncharacterized protein n=1 Tax=Enterospora canceri TaxID=1081671 RepID=A0A1Y1S8G0_9MICR|nr:hypothetical protein ECANGB1_681 [Enterospora canceri]